MVTVCQHIKYSDLCDDCGTNENIRTYICYHEILLPKILPQSVVHCRRTCLLFQFTVLLGVLKCRQFQKLYLYVGFFVVT